jgi:hypothetical protein
VVFLRTVKTTFRLPLPVAPEVIRIHHRHAVVTGQSHEISTTLVRRNQTEPQRHRGTEEIPFLTGRETTAGQKGCAFG